MFYSAAHPLLMKWSGHARVSTMLTLTTVNRCILVYKYRIFVKSLIIWFWYCAMPNTRHALAKFVHIPSCLMCCLTSRWIPIILVKSCNFFVSATSFVQASGFVRSWYQLLFGCYINARGVLIIFMKFSFWFMSCV